MPLIALPLLALAVVAGGWSLFIASQNVAEVQGYRSGWTGFWNLVLPGAIMFGVVAVIGVWWR